MKARVLNAVLLILLAVSSWILDIYSQDYELSKVVDTLLAISIVYLVFQVLVRFLIDKRVKERKAKHLFRRLGDSAFYLIVIFWLLTIWVENTETLLLSYGLVSATIAFALQDVIKDLIGGFVLLANRNYRVGDRIEIDGLVGDVVKISLLYTTIMEIRNWVDGDQPTGRLSIVPNGGVTKTTVHNFTKDHKFIWDEVSVPVTYQSNWKSASKVILSVLKKKQIQIDERVEKQMENLSRKYYFEEKITEPEVYIKITDNWIELNGRYISDTTNRRRVKSDINEQILTEFEKLDDVNIASETLEVYNTKLK